MLVWPVIRLSDRLNTPFLVKNSKYFINSTIATSRTHVSKFEKCRVWPSIFSLVMPDAAETFFFTAVHVLLFSIILILLFPSTTPLFLLLRG